MENLKLILPPFIIGLRYFFFAGFAYLLFYVWKNKKFIHKKIQPMMPKKESINNEIKYSISTILVFSCVFYLMYYLRQQGYSKTFAAFSFHPIEAFLEVGIIFIVLLIPINRYVLVMFSFSILFINIFGHLGFELYGKNFLKTFLGKVINTSTHHNMHHKYANCNYGTNYSNPIIKNTKKHLS